MDPIYTIRELCDRTGETARTIRYYVRLGLLPSAGSAGRGPRYHDGHVARLRLIRRLQKEHLPLSEIRVQLETLQDDEVIRLAAESEGACSGPLDDDVSALDYVRDVLSGDQDSPRSPHAAWSPRPTLAALRSEPLADERRTRARRGASDRTDASPAQTDTFPRERAQWERITLARDVELHVRRPQSMDMNRRLERLLEAARDLFLEE